MWPAKKTIRNWFFDIATELRAQLVTNAKAFHPPKLKVNLQICSRGISVNCTAVIQFGINSLLISCLGLYSIIGIRESLFWSHNLGAMCATNGNSSHVKKNDSHLSGERGKGGGVGHLWRYEMQCPETTISNSYVTDFSVNWDSVIQLGINS